MSEAEEVKTNGETPPAPTPPAEDTTPTESPPAPTPPAEDTPAESKDTAAAVDDIPGETPPPAPTPAEGTPSESKDTAAVDDTADELSKTDIAKDADADTKTDDEEKAGGVDDSNSNSNTTTTTTSTSNNSACPNSNWSKEKLTGSSGGSQRVSASSKSKRSSKFAAEGDVAVAPALWGRPGHLTDTEADVYFKFRDVVNARGGDFKDTVYSFGEEEGEVYALCRWCRARKYVFDDIMKMVEEATACRATAKAANFYPDPIPALGVETSLYVAQYPQVYSGFAKNGSPVYYSKTGVLNTEAIECLTTVNSIVKYHWNVMMHDFKDRLLIHKKNDPSFNKFECVCIMDLGNLTMGQLNSKTMTITKEQSAIDSLCFPETLNKMFIINSPRFFTATWTLIKGWLDPRTASKVEVISNRKTWEKALLEYIDEDQLASDYGGSGPNTQDTSEKETFTGKLKRFHSEVMSVRGSGSITYDIVPDEELEVSIYTRSNAGAEWTVADAKNKKGTTWVSGVMTKHDGSNLELMPTHVKLTKANIKGPRSIEVKAKSHGSRWTSEKFLVVISVFKV